MRILPPIVTRLTMCHDAWVVGSAARYGVDLKECRDIDVLVSFAHWREAACLIPDEAVPNTFGGWKFKDGDKTVDVWPGDLGWLLTNNMMKFAWHPRTDSRFQRVL